MKAKNAYLNAETLILALETSGRKGSVAIAWGPELLAETAFSKPMNHSAELLPAISGLLERFGHKGDQIQHIYFSAGPGSFTGLRIAATLAKTMHLANNTKIIAVDTLDVIAANADDYKNRENNNIKRIATILDAKRNQFFTAIYEYNKDGRIKASAEHITTAKQFLDRFADRDRPIWLLGEGLVYYKGKFQAESIKFVPEAYWWPKAAKVHQLGLQTARCGQFSDPLSLAPKYLREPDVGIKQ